MKKLKTFLYKNDAFYSTVQLEDPIQLDDGITKVKFPKGTRPYKTTHYFFTEEGVSLELFRIQRWNGNQWETVDNFVGEAYDNELLIDQYIESLAEGRYCYWGV